MLLRKTVARTVDDHVVNLFTEYGTPAKLANVSQKNLSKLLKPLGMYRVRAKAIRHVAKSLVAFHGRRVPKTYEELIELPHVGRYTANAVLCFAHNQRRPLVDANIVRLFKRFFGTRKPIEVHKAEDLWALATDVLPQKGVKKFNWAMLDLARTICAPANPKCAACPLSGGCLYFSGMKA